MNKKSFFQKLTGADDEEMENEDELDVEVKPESTPTPPPKPTAKNKTMKKSVAEKQNKVMQEDWLPETEGQLTIDVYQTPTDVVIKSTVAGVDPEDIDISISNDMVTIRGSRQKDDEVKTEDYYYQECYWGAFSRSVILPVDIEADKAEASFKNGVLTIRLPKVERVKTKKIKVKAA